MAKSAAAKMIQNVSVAQLSLQGMSQREIAKQIGKSQMTVSRVLNNKQVRQIIDNTLSIYAAHAKGIGKEFLRLCYDDDKTIKLSAIKEYNKIMGFSPSHTSNQFLVNVYNDNRQQTISPQVIAALGGNMAQLTGQDYEPIDADFAECKDSEVATECATNDNESDNG